MPLNNQLRYGAMLGLTLCLSFIAAAHAGEKQNLAVGVAFDTQGQLWRASLKQGQVWVDHSQPLKPGDTPKFSTPVLVDPKPIFFSSGGGLRLAIAIGDGKVWVAASTLQPTMHHTDVPDLSWFVSKLYLAVSNDQGVTFSTDRLVAEDTRFFCGAIALQATSDNQVVAMWDQSFDGGAKDYAMAKLDMQSPINIHRATFGVNPIDTCPPHAPALAKGGDWGWHMAWFNGGDKAGIYYARMDGDAWVSSPSKRFTKDQSAGQPSLLAIGEHVWLAWKQPNGQGTTINIAMSDDGGRSWSSPTISVQTQGESDDPILLGHGEQAYVSWNTTAGFRLLPL